MPDQTRKPAPRQPATKPADADLRNLEERVLGYFRRNSHAMDSADGIARFWVGESRRLVARCLGDLHERGLLQRRTIGGINFYSLMKEPQDPAALPAYPDTDREHDSDCHLVDEGEVR